MVKNRLTKQEQKIYNRLDRKIVCGKPLFLCKRHKCYLSEKACLSVQKSVAHSDFSWYNVRFVKECYLCSVAKIIQKKNNTTITFPEVYKETELVTCSICKETKHKDKFAKTYFGTTKSTVCHECNSEKSLYRYYSKKIERK